MPGGYVLSVSESAPVDTPVGTIVATDNDGGLNGTVSHTVCTILPCVYNITMTAIDNLFHWSWHGCCGQVKVLNQQCNWSCHSGRCTEL